MTCEPEKVTGLVDGALDASERERVEAHVRECATCQAQAAFERDLGRRLRSLKAPEPPETLEARVRGELRPLRRGPSRLRWLLPVAAALAAVALWTHGAPAFVASELAWDHGHCFDKKLLPAKVWTNDAATMEQWLDERMGAVPSLPESAGGLDLIGGRRCPVLDRLLGHVYYASGEHRLSVYVVPGWVRMGRSVQFKRGDRTVRLLRAGGATVGLVSEQPEAVEAFERALTTTYARGN
ncbi:MAG TPA: zf-HC2 domain-containing protein [Vicinamibacteria bacterium]|nr:zf-HC2 domain-containing protein [Vicinamibacteria bacterium]